MYTIFVAKSRFTEQSHFLLLSSSFSFLKCIYALYTLLFIHVKHNYTQWRATRGGGERDFAPPLSIFRPLSPPLPQLNQDIMTMTCTLIF